MARITRKELKSDKFAQEVGLTVTFFEEHQKDVVRYGGIGVAVALLIAGFVIYQNHERVARQEALHQAIDIQETPIAVAAVNGQKTYPTQAAKDQDALKAFSDLQSKHSGSDEAMIAGYYLGSVHADQGKMADAEKDFLNVVNNGDKNYSSLAKISLAEVYFAENKFDQGKQMLTELMEKPTIFVSKDQAAMDLARHLIGRDNAAARKLLAPIKDGKDQVASLAQQLYATIPPQ